MTEQENAPLVQNIRLEQPELVQPPMTDPRLKSDPRKDRTEEGAALPEPFTQGDMRKAMGLTSGGANSQVRRWMYWGWVESAGFGTYRRTANFGGEKKSVGYTKTRPKPEHPKYTSKGKLIKASLPCDFPGCNFIGYGSTEMNALRSVGRHKSMEHGVKKRYVSAAERRKLGLGRNTKFVIPRPGMNGATPPPEPPAPAPQPEHHIRFCPECGYNIQMHEISYRIARKHRKES